MALPGGTLSSGTSSGSSHGTRMSGSEGGMELQARMDLKRKRRMESNRKSAKMSRLRKQQHLDDLTSQVNQLRMENQEVVTALNITVQSYAAAEAQNSVLRTRRMELESRLCALREIIFYMNANSLLMPQHDNNGHLSIPSNVTATNTSYDILSANAWNSGMQMMQQPIDWLYQC